MVDLGHILETAVNAVMPIVLVIALGYCLRRSGFLTAEFVKVGSKLGFKCLLPIMLFINVYNIESFEVIQWDIVLYCMIMVVTLFLLGLVSVRFLTSVRERRGVILQAVFRSNVAIIGLSLASALGGSEAVAIASIVTAFTLPILNICAVISLTIFVGDAGEKIDIKGILINIAKNPLIRGILLGMVCLLVRSFQKKVFGEVVFALNDDVKFVYTALNNIKSIASPFALLVLGAQFDFSASKGMLREIIAGTLWRVVMAPVIAISVAIVLDAVGIISCGINEFPTLIALFGSPVAVSSAIMAGQMHNDEQLATQLVVWTSIASIATMFLTVCILMATGMLAV